MKIHWSVGFWCFWYMANPSQLTTMGRQFSRALSCLHILAETWSDFVLSWLLQDVWVLDRLAGKSTSSAGSSGRFLLSRMVKLTSLSKAEALPVCLQLRWDRRLPRVPFSGGADLQGAQQPWASALSPWGSRMWLGGRTAVCSHP